MQIKVFTAFSGYDSQCMALDRLHRHNPDFNYELVGWAEIDKYAIAAHNAVYPQYADRNYGDISKIDWAQVPDFDLFTYSSPCQDFSQAGKQAGGEQGSGTRSSLLWECERAIRAKRPKYLLMENVAALVSQKFIRLFNRWQFTLEGYGYSNFAEVLNAKQFGVPQNRERIFMVSIREEAARYEFPKPFPLTIRLKDVLEKEVEERYYLSQNIIDAYVAHRERQEAKGNGFGFEPTDGNGTARSITTHAGSRNTDNYLKEPIKEPIVLGWVRDEKGNVVKRPPVEVANTVTSGKRDNTQNYVVEPQVMTPKRTEYGKAVRKQYEAGELQEQRKNLAQLEPREDGISNTLTSVQKDNYVLIPEATKDGYIPMEMGGVCDLSYPNSDTRRGRVQEGGTVAPTLTCGCEGALRRIEAVEPMIYDDYNGRLREDQDTCGTLTTNCGNDAPRNGFKVIEPTIIQRVRGFNQGGEHEICPTISCNSFEHNNHLLERVEGENGYPVWQTETGVKVKKVFREKIRHEIPQVCGGLKHPYRIRKLTERECFRLMDVPEEYIDRIQAAGISRSQQYKMAGNSIVVACLFHIFRRLFIDTKPTTLTLF